MYHSFKICKWIIHIISLLLLLFLFLKFEVYGQRTETLDFSKFSNLFFKDNGETKFKSNITEFSKEDLKILNEFTQNFKKLNPNDCSDVIDKSITNKNSNLVIFFCKRKNNEIIYFEHDHRKTRPYILSKTHLEESKVKKSLFTFLNKNDSHYKIDDSVLKLINEKIALDKELEEIKKETKRLEKEIQIMENKKSGKLWFIKSGTYEFSNNSYLIMTLKSISPNHLSSLELSCNLDKKDNLESKYTFFIEFPDQTYVDDVMSSSQNIWRSELNFKFGENKVFDRFVWKFDNNKSGDLDLNEQEFINNLSKYKKFKVRFKNVFGEYQVVYFENNNFERMFKKFDKDC